MTFNGLNGGEAGEDACVPGQVMVRPGDRTSLKAGGDACFASIKPIKGSLKAVFLMVLYTVFNREY